MNRKLAHLTILLICALVMAAVLAPKAATPVKAAESIVPHVQKMLRHYRNHQDLTADVIEESLEEIRRIDPKAGTLWQKVMASWDKCNTMDIPVDVLPDGLPEDESLCIVVLGYELNPDGSMKKELIARLETALRSAEKYPNAYVAVTGGGTAANSDMTEAEAMASWLRRKGVSEDRLIIEKEAYSTTYNAVNTYGILVREYPEVKGIAIVTSDYHVPWGAAMFQTVCDYTEVYGKTVIPVIACAANTTNTKMDTMNYQLSGIRTITGIPQK